VSQSEIHRLTLQLWQVRCSGSMVVLPNPAVESVVTVAATHWMPQYEESKYIELCNMLGPMHIIRATQRAENRASLHICLIAVANVLRIQAETVCLLAFAAASTRLRSSGLNRTGTIVPLASAFASRGRPGFLGFGLFDSVIGSQLP
jgi:hypothetical protein